MCIKKIGDNAILTFYKYVYDFVFSMNVTWKPFFLLLGEFPCVTCKDRLSQGVIPDWVTF